MYENIADQIDYYEFFNEFNMPDTFNSWFLVTELHLWMILTRVMAEGSEKDQGKQINGNILKILKFSFLDGRFIRNCIVEAMWADVQQRAKKLSADNPSASRQQVGILSEQFQATLISYDEGIMSDDKILASALWRRFFAMQCNDYTKVEKLVKYVRQNVSVVLDNMTRDELIQTKTNSFIKWAKLN
jgi:cytochrome b pre-mRNA-processing protein 3